MSLHTNAVRRVIHTRCRWARVLLQKASILAVTTRACAGKRAADGTAGMLSPAFAYFELKVDSHKYGMAVSICLS